MNPGFTVKQRIRNELENLNHKRYDYKQRYLELRQQYWRGRACAGREMFVCEVYASIRRCVMLASYKGVYKHGRGPGICEENSPNLLESIELWMYGSDCAWEREMWEQRGCRGCCCVWFCYVHPFLSVSRDATGRRTSYLSASTTSVLFLRPSAIYSSQARDKQPDSTLKSRVCLLLRL